MWVCESCGCQGIAADLGSCPQCSEERQMPKATSGGASNAWEQQDAHAPEQSEPQIQGEHGPELTDLPAATGGVIESAPGLHVVSDNPAALTLPPGWSEADAPEATAPATPDYASMSHAALRDEAKARELPASGTKADLAARLAEHDAAQQASGATGSAPDATTTGAETTKAP